MKALFLVLIAVALAVLAAALAPVFLADPGLVQIRFGQWTVETSLLVLVLGVVLAWLVFHLFSRLWRLPAETARRLREERAMKQLEKGLLALSEGDWVNAERALQKSESGRTATTVRYLAAARAADGQDAADRADYYLEQADSGGRHRHFLVELTRGRMLVENQRYDEAIVVLQALNRGRRKNNKVLGLLARCYRETQRWQDLLGLLPDMRKAGMIDEAQAQEWSSQAAIAGLEQSQDLAALDAAWQALPKALRTDAGAVAAYANRASRLDGADRTEAVIRTALKSQWSSALLLPYGDPKASDAAVRIRHCEKWLVEHPDDANLHLALGRLCAREELWGKARQHMIRSLELQPSVGGYDSLGQLLDRRGELDLATACFRNALRISQGESPVPLPADLKRLAVTGAPST
jgi:HemY protein